MTSSTWGDGYQPPNVSAAPVEQPKLRPGRIWYLGHSGGYVIYLEGPYYEGPGSLGYVRSA